MALMQVDNISSPHIPGFEELGISPHSDFSRCYGAKELLLVELGLTPVNDRGGNLAVKKGTGRRLLIVIPADDHAIRQARRPPCST